MDAATQRPHIVGRPCAAPAPSILDGASHYMAMLSADETGFNAVMRVMRFPILDDGIETTGCGCCPNGELVAEDDCKWTFRTGGLVDPLDNVSVLNYATARWSQMFANEIEGSIHLIND